MQTIQRASNIVYITSNHCQENLKLKTYKNNKNSVDVGTKSCKSSKIKADPQLTRLRYDKIFQGPPKKIADLKKKKVMNNGGEPPN
jgi:hypothetical protein